MNTQVAKDKVITLDYHVTDPDGEVVDEGVAHHLLAHPQALLDSGKAGSPQSAAQFLRDAGKLVTQAPQGHQGCIFGRDRHGRAGEGVDLCR